jgi:hypothetical protein
MPKVHECRTVERPLRHEQDMDRGRTGRREREQELSPQEYWTRCAYHPNCHVGKLGARYTPPPRPNARDPGLLGVGAWMQTALG